MAIIISQVDVHWGYAFDGFVPSKTIFQSGALYTCKCDSTRHSIYSLRMCLAAIGIIGATVMPHSIFLGSALATQDRISKSDKLARVDTVDSSTTAATSVFNFRSLIPRPVDMARNFKKGFVNMFRIVPIEQFESDPKTHADRENNSYAFVRSHVYHGMIDMAISLLGIAVVINALYVLSYATVYYCTDAALGFSFLRALCSIMVPDRAQADLQASLTPMTC